MFGFTNERSLEPYIDWACILRFWYSAALEIKKNHVNLSFRNDRTFFEAAEFREAFNHLSVPKDEKAVFRQLVFSAKYFQSWREERVSDPAHLYGCNQPALDLQDESLSEAAERRIQNGGLELLIFSGAASQFEGCSPLEIARHDSGFPGVQLANFTTIEGLREWLGRQPGYFDPGLNLVPVDAQTVLVKQPTRFRYTGKVERRFHRRIYEEVNTGRLLYVDHGHPGMSAHLEVFSANREHSGTADISTGEIDTSKKVPGRVLRL